MKLKDLPYEHSQAMIALHGLITIDKELDLELESIQPFVFQYLITLSRIHDRFSDPFPKDDDEDDGLGPMEEMPADFVIPNSFHL
ncbi:hypothetical protein M422DRAFT_269793 [Sphaerobolus stellatus SS14]|uniref:Uncharacterized protein n=1 Tax=Sphaerobolus stellatus (strain SS14) TaxID=990650 RepID=A0A0C9UIT5_SPHS4|nr:hypothetical protein M422DRAFT_269793 [Sphaerobolus stellatus SS14]